MEVALGATIVAAWLVKVPLAISIGAVSANELVLWQVEAGLRGLLAGQRAHAEPVAAAMLGIDIHAKINHLAYNQGGCAS